MKLSGHVTEPHMIASFLMNDIARICRQVIDQHMRHLGLTRAQWYLLNYLYLYDGLSQQELADLIDLGKSNVAKQIYSLEKKGWVTRSPHESDGRSFRVYLMADMKSTIKKLNKIVSLAIQNLLARFSKKEVTLFINMLRGIDLQLEVILTENKLSPNLRKLLDEVNANLSAAAPARKKNIPDTFFATCTE